MGCPFLGLAGHAESLQKAYIQTSRLGIVGDSLSAAGMANPEIDLDVSRLALRGVSIFVPSEPKIEYYRDPGFFHIEEPILAPVRLFPEQDPGRFTGVGGWISKNVEIAKKKNFEVEEYSFGYMVGRALGINPENILMAAESGQRVSDIYPQFERLARHNGVLPELVLLSFNANDMCMDDILNRSVQDTADNYYNTVFSHLEKVYETLTPSENGTRIYYLGSLKVLQLLTKPSLLLKTVNYRGEGAFCSEIRNHKVFGGVKVSGDDVQVVGPPRGILDSSIEGSFKTKNFNREILEVALPGMCRGIFSVKPSDSKSISKLQAVYEAMIEAQKQAVSDIQQRYGQNSHGLSIEYVAETTRIEFENSEVANDCFHPSVWGQEKVAKTLLEYLVGRYPVH